MRGYTCVGMYKPAWYPYNIYVNPFKVQMKASLLHVRLLYNIMNIGRYIRPVLYKAYLIRMTTPRGGTNSFPADLCRIYPDI